MPIYREFELGQATSKFCPLRTFHTRTHIKLTIDWQFPSLSMPSFLLSRNMFNWMSFHSVMPWFSSPCVSSGRWKGTSFINSNMNREPIHRPSPRSPKVSTIMHLALELKNHLVSPSGNPPLLSCRSSPHSHYP